MTSEYFTPNLRKPQDGLTLKIKPVLEYLNNCKNAQFDWTTSTPLSPPSQKVRQAAINAYFYEEMHTYGFSVMHETLLNSIVSYFNRKSILCSKDKIQVRYTSFDILRDFYASLRLDEDGVLLIAAPTFGYYVSQAAECRIKTKLVFAKGENGWKITPEDLEEALEQSNAKLFLFTNPVNPTGVFYTKAEVEELSKVIKKYAVFTISDEIFSEISFDPNTQPYSIAAVDGMFERTLTLGGLGKSKGVRLSFSCGPLDCLDTYPVSGILKPIQMAAIEALKITSENDQYLAASIDQYQSRIRLIQDRIILMNDDLNEFYGTTDITYVEPFIIPNATNIFLLSVPGVFKRKAGQTKINNSLDLAKCIHQIVGIAMVPGEGFFIEGRKMALRIPMSITATELQDGLARILGALKTLL